MMLCKLSFKNIKKSFKDYAIYFFTLILGVAIFYVFNAIDSQTAMLQVSKSTYEIIKLMNNMLSGVSVFVSFVLGFLIIYASRFLIKRRNKEFGIYLTLGMSKGKISMILFFETLLIGILSLVVGLTFGAILSQFMSLLVANMFEADMTKFQFTFSNSAFIKTLIYFGIMYFLVMIFNTFSISKCKLIDLLQASKKSEKVKLKNPILCIIVFVIASIALGYAYYCVTGGIEEKLDEAWKIFIPIGLGIVSTFLLFWSISGLILKICMSMKKLYYKGLNSFTLRQISSKINTTVFSMTIICLMLFITICVFSSCLSLKNSMNANINDLAPADIELQRLTYKKPSQDATELMIDSRLPIAESLKKLDFDLYSYLKEYVEFDVYGDESITLEKTLGSTYAETKKEHEFMMFDSNEEIVRLSDYNKIARLYGNKEYQLEDNEYLIIADYDSMIQIRNKALALNEKLNIFGHELTPKYNKCQDGFINLAANHVNSGIIIVPDYVAEEEYAFYNTIIGNYSTKEKDEMIQIEEKLDSLSNDPRSENISLPDGTTRRIITEASIGLGALVTFIGLYLGIIFLMSSAAILALKELSESSDNKERFSMLRKIGADEKMINKALFRQIAIFFATPLVLALIHSIFGIKFCTFILETFGNKGLLPSIIMTAVFLIIIYGGYFIITYWCSKNIIKDR